MKYSSTLFCLLTVITVASTLSIKNEATYEITELPSNSGLLEIPRLLIFKAGNIMFNVCNMNTAIFKNLYGGKVSIGSWKNTGRYCHNDSDQVFLELISQAKRATFEENSMKLFNENGKLLLSAKKIA